MRFLGRLVLGLTLALGLGCTTRESFRYQEPPKAADFQTLSDSTVEVLRESVWQMDQYGDGKYVGYGSCVVVRHDKDLSGNITTLALTAAHCTDDDADTWVVLDAKGVPHAGKLVARGAYSDFGRSTLDKDWALVRFVGAFGISLTNFLVKGEPKVGLPIVLIGYTYGAKSPVSRGEVLDKDDSDRDGLLYYSANSGPGSSGGAVIGSIDGKPTLLAIHTRRVYDSELGVRCRGGVPMSSIHEQGGRF